MKVRDRMKNNELIAVACDHGGFDLKCEILKHLDERGARFEDFGTYSTESCDYPDYAEKACRSVISGKCGCAILVCGTGIGISIAANKIKGIRAAVCTDTFCARFTRLHNDANVLCLGGRVVGPGLAADIVDAFLDSDFEGGRHSRRIEKISALENENR